MRPGRLSPAVILVSLLGMTVRGEENKVTFKDQVSTIFQTKCNTCHNAEKKRGGLALDSYAATMEGGASGSVIEPGDPENSRLFLVMAHEEEPAMPPSSPKLSDDLLETVKAWIAAGAPESSSSVVAVAAKPKMDLALDPATMGKPLGEPAMPKDLPTQPLVVSERPNAILALAASPWAPLVAIAGHRQVLLYDVETGWLRGVLPFEEGVIHSLRFSRDGGILIAGGGVGGQSGRAVGWDVKTGERLFEVGKEYDVVLSADISPDRRFVAIGGPSKLVRVYSTTDGELVYEAKKHTEWVTSVTFSPDGVLLASGDRNGGLIIWEAWTGREFYDLRGHSAQITGLSWRLDSNVVASSSEDGSIRLWNMLDGGALKNWGAHGGGAMDVRFAKDGRLVSVGRDRVTKVWDQGGTLQREFEAFGDVGLQAAYLFDENRIVAGDWSGEVRIWSVAEGQRLANLSANPPTVPMRLERARAELDAAEAAAVNAQNELRSLETSLAETTAAESMATQLKSQAERVVLESEGELQSLEARLAQSQADEAEARALIETSIQAREQAIANRLAAETALTDRAVRTRVATEILARTLDDTDRDRAVAAARETTEAAQRVEQSLNEFLLAVQGVAKAQLRLQTVLDTRPEILVNLERAQTRLNAARETLAARESERTAAAEAKVKAENALAERSTALRSIIEKPAALQAQLEDLSREAQALAADAAERVTVSH